MAEPPPDVQPFTMDDRMLVGERVRLRALRREDLPTIAEHYNDRDVVQFLSFWDAPYGQDDARAWFDRTMAAPPHERSMAIALLPDDTFAGVLSVGVAWRPRSARMGIAIWNPDARGKGFGTEALRLLLDHCFLTLNLNRVELSVWAYNARAMRAYCKAGFVEEGRRRQAWYWDGGYHDVVEMGVLREEHLAR